MFVGLILGCSDLVGCPDCIKEADGSSLKDCTEDTRVLGCTDCDGAYERDASWLPFGTFVGRALGCTDCVGCPDGVREVDGRPLTLVLGCKDCDGSGENDGPWLPLGTTVRIVLGCNGPVGVGDPEAVAEADGSLLEDGINDTRELGAKDPDGGEERDCSGVSLEMSVGLGLGCTDPVGFPDGATEADSCPFRVGNWDTRILGVRDSDGTTERDGLSVMESDGVAEADGLPLEEGN